MAHLPLELPEGLRLVEGLGLGRLRLGAAAHLAGLARGVGEHQPAVEGDGERADLRDGGGGGGGREGRRAARRSARTVLPFGRVRTTVFPSPSAAAATVSTCPTSLPENSRSS